MRAQRTSVAQRAAIAGAAAVALAALLGLGAIRAPAQVAAGAAGATVFTVRPIPTPAPLQLSAVPKFDFAAELVNSGVPLPGLGGYIVVEGTGSVLPSPKNTFWRFEFLKVVIDTAVISSASPLAILSVETDAEQPDLSSFALGFAPPQVLPPRSPAHRVLDTATRTLIAALSDPSTLPVAVGSPVVDVSEGVRRYLKRFLQPLEMTDPINPLVAEGLTIHQGRVGVVARGVDRFQLRYGPQPVALDADATMMFDRPTALPLLSDFRITGAVRLPNVSGPVDARVKVYVSIGGMRSPTTMLRGIPPAGRSAPTPAAAPAPSQPKTGPAPAQPQAAPARRAAPPRRRLAGRAGAAAGRARAIDPAPGDAEGALPAQPDHQGKVRAAAARDSQPALGTRHGPANP